MCLGGERCSPSALVTIKVIVSLSMPSDIELVLVILWPLDDTYINILRAKVTSDSFWFEVCLKPLFHQRI